MNEPEVNNQLSKQDLFTQFRQQLARDFENCGLPVDFTEQLPPDFLVIRDTLVEQTEPHFSKSPGMLMQLLYRVDISEVQLKKYSAQHKTLSFPEVVAELIIKRELQKIILKRTFSR